MCRRSGWINVGKDKFLEACKDHRIGSERAEKLWLRLNAIAMANVNAAQKARMEGLENSLTREYPFTAANPYEKGNVP